MPRPLPVLILFVLTGILSAQEKKAAPARKKPALDPVATEASKGHEWATWVEPGAPFFGSVVDARHLGGEYPADNMTPRGLVLNLGHDFWACFDTDLLRMSLVWKGESGQPPLTQESMSTGSYHIAGQKNKDGQNDTPKPIGTPWQWNGIYAGWQVLKADQTRPSLNDPRAPGPTEKEVGRGPLAPAEAQLTSVRPTSDGVDIIMSVGGREVHERIRVEKLEHGFALIRTAIVSPGKERLIWVAGKGCQVGTTVSGLRVTSANVRFHEPQLMKSELSVSTEPGYGVFEPSEQALVMGMTYLVTDGKVGSATVTDAGYDKPAVPRWPEPITTKIRPTAGSTAAYVLDEIPLPLTNPWKRNVRLADLAFLNDQGDAAGVTYDGDVWLISGLKGDNTSVQWRRYASGFHEPLSIVSRRAVNGSSELFVFDRNGIWKLKDTNADGEADVYEMFCNQFSQTAETREFANSMKLAPDGSFIISKGGQQGATLGKDNGKVLRISPDGRKVETVAWGLRQPFIGVHPKTGLITASDQQGNYVPSTPIHIIKDNQYYGHLASIQPAEKYPAAIAEPLTWIPHPVNPSGATQVWMTDARMGPLADECLHIGYNRPELFRVLFNSRFARPQGAVVPLTRAVDFAPLNGTLNPADGQIYISGFQIWGSTAKKISGLSRLHYTGVAAVVLQECTPMDKGVLLKFHTPLDEASAASLSNYSVERWNYERTAKYGSPHLKLDGSPGQDWMTPSSVYLSEDKKSVFLGLPDMKGGVMQMRVGWGLKGADGSESSNSVYFTPYELATFQPSQEGFGDIQVDLTPRQMVAAQVSKPTLEEGKRLYEMTGCMACHSIDGTVTGKVGPSWKGLFDSERVLKDGKTKVKADNAYLHESIVNPGAKIPKGYEKLDAGMPIYAGILTESQIQSLILYIESLKN